MNCATPSAPAGLVAALRNPLSVHSRRARKPIGKPFAVAASVIVWQIKLAVVGRRRHAAASRQRTDSKMIFAQPDHTASP